MQILRFIALVLILGQLSAAGTETRKTFVIEGWSVHVHRELLENEPMATNRALEIVKEQLQGIVKCMVPEVTEELRKVPLYFSPVYPGVRAGANFHPSAKWLEEHGRDPGMAKAVEFTNILIFEKESVRMPNLVLHELSHAYHNRVLKEGSGAGDREIKEAYEAAVASGKYDRVERWHGTGRANTFERAYAMNNRMEYFAETSEAFFGRNDYFPFTQAELEQHDPVMFALLAKLWRVPLDRP